MERVYAFDLRNRLVILYIAFMRRQSPNPDPRRRAYSVRPGLAASVRPNRTLFDVTLPTPSTRQSKLEAALFLADEPLTKKTLLQVTGIIDAETLREEIAELTQRYEADGTAFQIQELAGGFQLLTRSNYHPWLLRHFKSGDVTALTPSLLESLAIIAYRQPITRAEVDQIRGVQSQEMINQLIERGLVRIAGRHDSLGRPVLYGTTRQFLQVFGLKSIEDLPEIS
jgi:segregation and condensation protein B